MIRNEYCVFFNTKKWSGLWRYKCNNETSYWEEGKYVGTLTEGDLLWKLKNTPELNFKNINEVSIKDVERRVNHKSVTINQTMENLISLAISQNFVPVVDDNGIFIGIIKRSDIIEYCYKELYQESKI